jgi:hypothetical protein
VLYKGVKFSAMLDMHSPLFDLPKWNILRGSLKRSSIAAAGGTGVSDGRAWDMLDKRCR